MAKIKIVTKSDTYYSDKSFEDFITQATDLKGFYPFQNVYIPYHEIVKVEQLKEKLNG